MEEESEKISLTKNENPDTKVESAEQAVEDNKENVTAESTLIQVENNKEEKKSKLFSFFERKKVSASEGNEEDASATQSSGFRFSKLFKKDAPPKTGDAEEVKHK